MEAATLLADIAVVSGHIGKAETVSYRSEQRTIARVLIDLGITAGAEAMDGVKALMVFGEDVNPELLKDVEFMMVCDTHMTETARSADVVIPGTGFAAQTVHTPIQSVDFRQWNRRLRKKLCSTTGKLRLNRSCI